MINRLKQYFRENKTTYLYQFTIPGTKTGEEAFKIYKEIIPESLHVDLDNFQTRLTSNYNKSQVRYVYRIDCWVWIEDRKKAKKTIKRIKKEEKLSFLSKGHSKRKFKNHFKWKDLNTQIPE